MTGPGIPPDEYNKVFEPFYQAENASNKGVGVGIGLSLVRLLVEKHNGKVYINSNYTEGCEVCVEIPHLERSLPTDDFHISTPDEEPAPDESIEPNGYSILIVEDTTDSSNSSLKI